MRNFVGNPMIKQDLEAFEQIREFAIAFCQYINAGGSTNDYTNALIDKVIDETMKLKANRDRLYKYCGYDIPMYDDTGVRISKILN